MNTQLNPLSDAQTRLLKEVAAAENGKRHLTGCAAILFFSLAICWSFFQIWITSPIPYMLGFGVINDTGTRSIHLTFAMIMAFLAFPAKHRLSSSPIPVYDWVLAIVAAFCAIYLYVFAHELSIRPGAPLTLDLIVSVLGIVTLLEATRRVMGLPMTILAILFLIYAFAGPWMPDLISHKGASLARAASQMWLSSEGVFGVALGVSTSFVFVYVLFGAMLEKAGAGHYLTRLSFALLGHMRGGPAKAAVVASGLHGLISGSSTANVLTCGPVTIPLMKKVGFSAEKAGAIEVAAGSNGQIMPPVMGAAAFLMTEYVNIPYSELIKHAFIPAILAYVSLLFIVHLESCKMGLIGIPRQSSFKQRMIGWAITISTVLILANGIKVLMGWMPNALGHLAIPATLILLTMAYLGCLYYSSFFPEIKEESAESLTSLPPIRSSLLSGLHYLLPLITLIVCLVVYEMSPGLAAFYGCIFMSFILLTQRPLIALFRKRPIQGCFKQGIVDWGNSLISGARNMIGIALATAAAGIIVGVVSLTGIGQVLSEVVEVLSMGSLIMVLLLTAFLSLLLGMGLPTTANYIVVSTLLVPVISSLAVAHGVAIPLIALHLFVFYFGIMADATPPVALAAFAAAGIANGDPLKTGVQGFLYEIRTAILPFVFIFNTELLLLGDIPIWQTLIIVLAALVACFVFAAFMQNFWLVKNTIWETFILIVAMIILFRPGFVMSQFFPKYQDIAAEVLQQEMENITAGTPFRLKLEVDEGHKIKTKTLIMQQDQTEKINFIALGIDVRTQIDPQSNQKTLWIDRIKFNSIAEKSGLDSAYTYQILGADIQLSQPNKSWFTIPGFLLVIWVGWRQTRRKTQGMRSHSSF